MTGTRIFGLIGATAAAVAGLCAEAPYLAVVGPSALRFENSPPPPSQRPALPPLALPAPVPVGAEPANPEHPPGPPPAPTNAPPAPPLNSSTGLEVLNTNPVVQTFTPEPQILAPSMFLKYFIRTSNGPGHTAIIPLPGAAAPGTGASAASPSFTPPSRATYSAPP